MNSHCNVSPALHLSWSCAAGLASLVILSAHVHAQTQAQMNVEARKDFERADTDLNKAYQLVLAKLPDAKAKEKLREAQRAWVASRDAEAARAAKEGDGGTIAPTLRYETMTELTRKRITELSAMSGQGSASARQSERSPSPNEHATPNAISPDGKWEYKPATATDKHRPEIVKAGTNETAGDLSDDCDIGSCGDSAAVFWAPDSKRFAFHWGQGRTDQTSFYQLRGDDWQAIKSVPNDDVSDRLQDDITAQLKKSGQSQAKLEKKGLYLRFIRQETKPDRWIDANTVVLFASQQNVIAKRDDPGEMSDGFEADFLFTLKFDDTANWKIVQTHRMSQKEVDKWFKEE